MKLIRLNQKGVAHYLLAAAVVAVVGGIGVYVLTQSHADTPSYVFTADEMESAQTGLQPATATETTMLPPAPAVTTVADLVTSPDGVYVWSTYLTNLDSGYKGQPIDMCVAARSNSSVGQTKMYLMLANANNSKSSRTVTLSSTYQKYCTGNVKVVTSSHDPAMSLFARNASTKSNADIHVAWIQANVE